MLAGVLIDVSGSMSNALQLDVRLEDQPVTRAQSIFSTIISIVERESGIQNNEEIFVLAFGLADVNTCDLLALLDDVRRLDKQYKTTGHQCLTRLLEANGAPYTGEYIKKYLSQQAAGTLSETFSQNPTFLMDTVEKLPSVCKNAVANITYSTGAYSAGLAGCSTVQAWFVTVQAWFVTVQAWFVTVIARFVTVIAWFVTVIIMCAIVIACLATVIQWFAAFVIQWFATVIRWFATVIHWFATVQTAGYASVILRDAIVILWGAIIIATVCTIAEAVYTTTKARYATAEAVYETAEAWYSCVQSTLSRVQDYVWSSFQNANRNSNIEELMQSSAMNEENSEEKIAEKYIKEAMQSSATIKLKNMLRPQKRPLDDVVSLLREVASSSNSSPLVREPLTAAQLSHLVDAIKPYIYGDTPMCKALGYALETFESAKYPSRVLFVLSDGKSTDGDPVKLAEQLHRNNVIIFTCLLTSENIAEPRRLYDAPDLRWSKEQREMFAMSSTVSNTSPVMAILLKKQWQLPASGQSRLFLHANHPEVIHEFSSLVREIAQSNDALLDMLGCISLDLYINVSNAMFDPKQQTDETCYAYAVATVFHLAMCRIGGREGGVPNFSDLRDQLIEEYGINCAITKDVLHKWAPFYRLRYKQVEELEARQAINARHTLVATFRLTGEQWDAFKRFYEINPKGILETQDLQTSSSSTKTFGHAVVLIRCDATSLTFINSWGIKFANGGFFKIKDQSVLNKLTFYDVYWELENLTPNERATYQSRCRNLAQELAQNLPSSVQNLLYECPQCLQSLPANEFTGHLLEATCPECHDKFKPTALGLMRSLYAR